MTTQSTQDFLDSTDIDGPLSPEQAAALMALAMGDTGANASDTGGLPGTTTETEDKPDPDDGQDKDKGTTEPEGSEKQPVLMAKDGVHTIDYQKLVDARQGEQHWKAQAEALQVAKDAAEQELASLRAAAQARADAGAAPTEQDKLVKAADAAIAGGADVSLFGDFSEEALAKGIDLRVEQLLAQRLDAAVSKAIKPLQERHEQSLKAQEQAAADTHRDAVLAAHPDAVSIYQSKELQTWLAAKPGYEQTAIRGVLDSGETADLIAVFDRYKAEAGLKPAAAPAAPDLKAAAKAAVEKAAPAVPASLSGIPGGRSGATGVHEQLDAMDAQALGAAMLNGMSPEAIERFLNRQI